MARGKNVKKIMNVSTLVIPFSIVHPFNCVGLVVLVNVAITAMAITVAYKAERICYWEYI